MGGRIGRLTLVRGRVLHAVRARRHRTQTVARYGGGGRQQIADAQMGGRLRPVDRMERRILARERRRWEFEIGQMRHGGSACANAGRIHRVQIGRHHWLMHHRRHVVRVPRLQGGLEGFALGGRRGRESMGGRWSPGHGRCVRTGPILTRRVQWIIQRGQLEPGSRNWRPGGRRRSGRSRWGRKTRQTEMIPRRRRKKGRRCGNLGGGTGVELGFL